MRVQLDLAQVGSGSHIFLDGREVSSDVRAVEVRAGVHELTTMVVEYNCVEVVVNGEVDVIHHCPYREEDEDA